MKKRRGYLKHFNSATDGESIQNALKQKQYIAIALHWAILEEMNKEGSAKITRTLSFWCKKMHLKRDKMIKEFRVYATLFHEYSVDNSVNSYVDTGKMSEIISEIIYEIFSRNYLKSQKTRVPHEEDDEDKKINNKKRKFQDNKNTSSSKFKKPGNLTSTKSLLIDLAQELERRKSGITSGEASTAKES